MTGRDRAVVFGETGLAWTSTKWHNVVSATLDQWLTWRHRAGQSFSCDGGCLPNMAAMAQCGGTTLFMLPCSVHDSITHTLCCWCWLVLAQQPASYRPGLDVTSSGMPDFTAGSVIIMEEAPVRLTSAANKIHMKMASAVIDPWDPSHSRTWIPHLHIAFGIDTCMLHSHRYQVISMYVSAQTDTLCTR